MGTNNTTFVFKSPSELKINPYNLSIYGSEPLDWDLVYSIEKNGLLEPLVIKSDNTIISGHRRWKALQHLRMGAPCRISSFDNEDDEQLAIIEFNRQRKKTTMQVFNESETLDRIYRKDAEKRKLGNLKHQNIDPANLPDRGKVGETREKLSEATGVPQKKLETIIELGKLAKTGKTKEERKLDEEHHARIKTEYEDFIRLKESGKLIKSGKGKEPVGIIKPDEILHNDRRNEYEEEQKIKEIRNETIKEVATGIMKEIDNNNISFTGARDLIKIITENPAEAKEILETKKAEPEKTIQQIIDNKVDKNQSMPHVSFNAGNNEWYTPIDYINAAIDVMGIIDLDPASSEIANGTVKAKNIFTAANNGLTQGWTGKIWLNPPYAAELISDFCNKLSTHFLKNEVTEAIVLVNNATETGWFNTLIKVASAVVFPSSRIRFWAPDGKLSAPLQGQAVIYLGSQPDKFIEHFKQFGWGASL